MNKLLKEILFDIAAFFIGAGIFGTGFFFLKTKLPVIIALVIMALALIIYVVLADKLSKAIFLPKHTESN